MNKKHFTGIFLLMVLGAASFAIRNAKLGVQHNVAASGVCAASEIQPDRSVLKRRDGTAQTQAAAASDEAGRKQSTANDEAINRDARFARKSPWSVGFGKEF